MHYGLTGFVAGNGVDSPNFIAAALPVRTLTGTNVGLSGDANKVTYYTPRVAGMQFGVSYAPTSTHGGGSSSSGGTNVVSTAGNDKVDDVVSIGVNYEYKVQRDLKVALSGGYETGSGNGARKDPDLWVFGGSLSAGGFTVAAAYQDREDAAGNDIDEEAWGLSGSYKVGPWQVGVGYVRGERSGGDVGVNVDATAINVPGAEGGTNLIGASFDRDNEFDHIQVGGSYDMGNGISVGLGFDWYKIENRSHYNTADTASADPVIATALEEEESWALSLLLSATF
jgi:predicted porin